MEKLRPLPAPYVGRAIRSLDAPRPQRKAVVGYQHPLSVYEALFAEVWRPHRRHAGSHPAPRDGGLDRGRELPPPTGLMARPQATKDKAKDEEKV